MNISNIQGEFFTKMQEIWNPHIKYIFLSGSQIYSQSLLNSDMDFLMVLHNSIYDTDYKNLRIKSNNFYFNFSEKYGLPVDRIFPGEIISEEMLKYVKMGGGYTPRKSRINLPLENYKDSDWLNCPKLEYLCWRSMFFFTNEENLFCYDREIFNKDRVESIFPLLLFLIKNNTTFM